MRRGGVIAGLLLALLAHLLALGTAGAGHGWNTPFRASFVLWILLPLTLATISPLGSYRPEGKRYLLSMAAVALATDVALIWMTVREGTEYFWKMMSDAAVFPILWLAIWFSWQLIVGFALARGSVLSEEMP